MKKLELFYPLKPFFITQIFGVNGDYYRRNGIDIAGHTGLDLRAYHKQPVYAAHDGVITYAGVDSKEGYGIVIRTDESYEYKGEEMFFKSIYWHLLPNFPVKFGDKVKAGDLIGYADNTGFSTGDHLHFALKPIEKGEQDWQWSNLEKGNGYYGAIDPYSYFNKMHAEDIEKIVTIQKLLISALERLIGLLKR